MQIEELYRRWAVHRLGRWGREAPPLEDVTRVTFHSYVGTDGTFDGTEVWTLNVETVAGRRSVPLYDENPVASIMSFARGLGEPIEFEEETYEQRLERVLDGGVRDRY